MFELELNHLAHVLNCLSMRQLLLNGKIEKQLKALFANYYEANEPTTTYYMDKRFQMTQKPRKSREIDLLTTSWTDDNMINLINKIEFKCTLASDFPNCVKEATSAIQQANDINQIQLNFNVMTQDAIQSTYIVHFLIATPITQEPGQGNFSTYNGIRIPSELRSRFPNRLNQGQQMTGGDLLNLYRNQLNRHQNDTNSELHNITIHHLNDLQIDAVVLNI